MDSIAQIEQLLPHAPPMVLLDSIIEHSDEHIICQADSHLEADNPLRCDGQLSIYAGIEYAAQAMAVHTRLQAQTGGAPRKGIIAVASKLKAHAMWLDDTEQPLSVRADIIAQTSDSTLCAFVISADNRLLLQGQLTAMLMAD